MTSKLPTAKSAACPKCRKTASTVVERKRWKVGEPTVRETRVCAACGLRYQITINDPHIE